VRCLDKSTILFTFHADKYVEFFSLFLQNTKDKYANTVVILRNSCRKVSPETIDKIIIRSFKRLGGFL